ncbi:MAG TPA: metallophosphoesterase [Bryobacteraceae bacterium]|nr:metallophosphoesterase [Bryobacteraceae bacterium]
MTKHLFLATVVALLACGDAGAQSSTAPRLPNKPDSVKFLVLGDTGTGDRAQYEIAQQAIRSRATFNYSFAILLGDNLYGGEKPSDYDKKFERPYKPLLDAGVKFYASLGNHDDANQRFYKHFNMNGERYYSFKPKDGVRLFALDSNYMTQEQLQWADKELASSGSEWKIAFFHHPLYSSGKRHGPDDELRQALEPLLVKHGVSVAFTGHEHFYERIKPQKGVHHFIVGSAGKLRKSNIRAQEQTARGFDQDLAFMLVEIDGDTMSFQTISRTGAVVDFGTVEKFGKKAPAVITDAAPPDDRSGGAVNGAGEQNKSRKQ